MEAKQQKSGSKGDSGSTKSRVPASKVVGANHKNGAKSAGGVPSGGAKSQKSGSTGG